MTTLAIICTGQQDGIPYITYNGMPPAGAAGPYILERKVFFTNNIPVQPHMQHYEWGLRLLISRVHALVVNLLSAFKGVLGDMNATSDLLQLVINSTKFCEHTFHVPNLQLLAKAFINITDFNSARSWLSRSYDILSGVAATQEWIHGGWDYLRVASKSIYLVKDVCTTMKWLESIGVLSAIVAKEIAVVRAFGSSLSLTLGRISFIANLVGTIPNFIDNVRLVVKYSGPRSDMLERERRAKLVGFSLDAVSDICRVAGSLLFCVANPWFPFLGLVVTTIGTLVSLGKFYYNESTRVKREEEKTQYSAKKESAVNLCALYLRMSALHRNDVGGVSQAAMDAVRNALAIKDMNERPRVQNTHVLHLADDLLRSAGTNLGGQPGDQIQEAIRQKIVLDAVRA